MIPQIGRRLCRAVLGGFLIGSSLIGYAQEDSTVGIVRITDARPSAQTVGFGGHRHQGYVDLSGTCPGDCPADHGNCPHGHHCWGKHGHLHHLFCEHYCTRAADHDFSIPAKYPIYRRGVQYNAYFPAKWYGTPGETFSSSLIYPTVYQPTDTTQLGYYYQHVPFWTPNPNMLPPRPIPAQWHHLTPVKHAPWHGHFGPGIYGSHGVHGSGWVESSTLSPSPTPAQQPSIEQVPPPSDMPPAPIPDAAPNHDSAQHQPIRRAVMQH